MLAALVAAACHRRPLVAGPPDALGAFVTGAPNGIYVIWLGRT